MDLYTPDPTTLNPDTSRCHPDHAMVSISTLVGDIGKYMKRWKSLDIILPKNDPRSTLRQRIWQLFVWPSPNLVTLSIGPIGPIGDNAQNGSYFLDLSSLEVFKLGSDITQLDFLPLKFNSIKSMALEAALLKSLHLSRFTRLERLVVHYCQR